MKEQLQIIVHSGLHWYAYKIYILAPHTYALHLIVEKAKLLS